MSETRVVKVLFLDDAPWYLPDLESAGVTLEIIQEGQFGTCDVYKDSRSVCELVRNLTTDKKVDIIVVGNNLGAGVAKAAAIAHDMKDKAIVVWNFYRKGDGQDAPYAAHGLRHFGSRSDLADMIPAMLGITA